MYLLSVGVLFLCCCCCFFFFAFFFLSSSSQKLCLSLLFITVSTTHEKKEEKKLCHCESIRDDDTVDQKSITGISLIDSPVHSLPLTGVIVDQR